MNVFEKHGVDESAFGEKGNIVQAFDAFPKAKPEYVTRTSGGGKWTVAMLFVSSVLVYSEFRHWWRGYQTHSFSVEKGIGHDMQINLDMIVAMSCLDVNINVQDAAGDRILAGEKLKRDATNWAQWVDKKGMHALGTNQQGRSLTNDDVYEHEEGFGEDNVRDIIATAGGKKVKFPKTPKVKGYPLEGNSCRIYGSLDVNKVQGDFHVTARGHGYQEFGLHLDHSTFNFSHIITELSFGDFYPSLLNPLDGTISTCPNHFQKYQYFLSIVPTIYSVESSYSNSVVYTNQFAVTDQSQMVGERSVPGIFFKYDIEPMLLIIEESRDGFLQFLIKMVNVVSGVLVTCHWGFTLTEWGISILGKKKQGRAEGVLDGRLFDSGYY
ncbi:hypothetical protein K3495_g7606 [Podosphaera aphanis]|nr:hypothetical protein K3495_g7606 [Podosphaera aphanis]